MALTGAIATTAPLAAIDIVDMIPATLGGLTPEIGVVRGMEHLDAFDSSIEGEAEGRASIEAFLEALGASVDDMTSVSAFAGDEESFALLAGIQVAGAGEEPLLQLYLLSLIGSMISPYQELGEMGGKTATLVIDEGAPDSAPIYVYGSGDTVWLIAAEESIVEDVLEQLP